MSAVLKPGMAAEIEQHRRAVRLNPRDANAHALLGLALLKQRQVEEGVAGVRRALELNPKMRGLHAILAAALFELQQYEAALDAYRQALRFQDDADLHQGVADTLLRLKRAAEPEAERAARRAVELRPDNIACLLSLGTVLHAQNRLEDAAALFRRVLELEPERVDVRCDLGHTMFRLHRHPEAIACYREVVARQPDYVNVWRHMGLSHRSLRQADAAASCFERALELAPDHAALMCDLAATLQMQGRLSQAVPLLRRSLELDPHQGYALRALAHVCFAMGEWREAVEMSRRALEIDDTPDTHSMMLFILSHCCNDPEELTREHFAFGERWEAPLRGQWQPHPNPRDPQRPLRVGIVSGDLYNHAVALFIAPVFEALKESQQLSLFAYYNNRIEDDMTRRLRDSVAVWRPIAGLDDDAAEHLIREDGIDILIDLSGHSALNRLPLFARKPAPVQATWIGYGGTTGLQSMDYVLADRYWLPPGRYDGQFTEKVVRLPLGWTFQPERNAPPVNELPAQRNGYLTFGSFHRAGKLSRDVIAHWAKLLHAVPDAKMLLGGLQHGSDELLVDWFALEGIPRERLLLRRRASVYDYLAQHHDVDVCLSPFPYTGSTTIGHALWMGVPTLAMTGPTNASHASVVFMAHLGLHTFITEDEDTYVRLGVFLNENISALAAMRSTMRQRFVDSVLGYPGVAAAGMELGLRKMWERWCAGEAPAALSVELSELVPGSADAE
jgi:predicted O-linked N-acetylglucosamine transferase (SPINDLY family)